MSACLFNLHAEYIRRNTGLDEAQAGIKIAKRNNYNLRYADDIIIFFKGVQPRAAPGQRVNDTRPVTGVILQGSTSLAGAVPGAAMGAGGPGRALERAAGR